MENINTNIDLLSGTTQSSINTSSKITVDSNPQLNNNTQVQTTNNGYTNQVEELDLSQEVQPDNRNFFQKAGDWLVDTGKSIYDTGANIVNDAKSWISGNLKGAGATLAETASNLAGDVVTIGTQLGEVFATVKATGAVVGTSIVSGVAKLGEIAVDGVSWVGGKVAHGATWLLGSAVGVFDEAAGESIKNAGAQADQSIKEFIAEDWIGKANEWFYENTDVGRLINEYSLMKYDSAAAMKIRDISEKAAEFAAATALMIATGGLATFAIGGVVGFGKAAESTYQTQGTNTTLLNEVGIAGSGVLSGLSWLANGRLGQGFLGIKSAIDKIGFQRVASKLVKDIVSKDFWKSALKDGLTGANGIGNYVSSAMMTADDVIPYLTGEKEWDGEAVAKLGLTYLSNLGLNIAEDALRGYVTRFDAEIAIDPTSITNTTDLITEASDSDSIERLENTGNIPLVKESDEIADASSRIKQELNPNDFVKYDDYLETEASLRISEYTELQKMIANGEELTPLQQARFKKISTELSINNSGLSTALTEAQSQVASIKNKIANEGLTEELQKQLAFYEHQVEVYDDAIKTLNNMEGTVKDFGYESLKEYGAQKYEDSIAHGAVDPTAKAPAYVSPEMQKYADDYAHSIRANAEKVEAAITEDLRSLEDESIFLTGEKYRLKGEESLSRKIIFDASNGKNITEVTPDRIDKAANRIADSVRYTYLIDEEDYAKKIPEVVEALKAKGYEISIDGSGTSKFKNSWKEGALYQGVNVNFTKMIDDKPFEFEVQFHTPDSFLTKEKYTHLIYEVRRGKYTLAPIREEANRIQKEISNAIRIPPGIIGLVCK